MNESITSDPPEHDPSKGGRPSTLDEMSRGKLVMALAAGLTLRETAAWVRCPKSTVNDLSRRDERIVNSLSYYAELARLHPRLCLYLASAKSWRGAVCLLELLERRHGEFTSDRLLQALTTTLDNVYASERPEGEANP